MARIGICAGHSAVTRGERLYEWKRCNEVLELLCELLKGAGHGVHRPPQSVDDMPNNEALNAKIAHFNFEEVDLAIELHLNAGGGDYSTCLYVESEQGKRLAEKVCDQFDARLPWPTIGARSMIWSGPMRFLRKCKAPAVITEAGFKDSPVHRAWMDSPGFA